MRNLIDELCYLIERNHLHLELGLEVKDLASYLNHCYQNLASLIQITNHRKEFTCYPCDEDKQKFKDQLIESTLRVLHENPVVPKDILPPVKKEEGEDKNG